MHHRIPDAQETAVEVLCFGKSDATWKELIKLSRSCKVNILDDYDFVFGPMCTNPDKLNRQEPNVHHPKKKMQLCSKSRDVV